MFCRLSTVVTKQPCLISSSTAKCSSVTESYAWKQDGNGVKIAEKSRDDLQFNPSVGPSILTEGIVK